MSNEPKLWEVLQSVELGAPGREVWNAVGGFFTIHHWHPDIANTEIVEGQTDQAPIRRLLTFHSFPQATEELVLLDSVGFHCRYRWFEGPWGEQVKEYEADLRVFDLSERSRCVVQWSSSFRYTEDAVSEFYWNGFRALQDRFPLTPEP